MVVRDEFLQIRAAEVVNAFSQCILQVETVDAGLIGIYDVAVIRHSFGDPVVSAQGLHPPDLIDIGKGHAVHLIGAVFLDERRGAQYAFARAADVGKNDGNKVFFADPAGLHGSFLRGRVINDQGIRAQDSLVGGDGFCGGHRYVCGVDACASPDAFAVQGVGHCAVAKGIVRKIYFDMADDGYVVPGLIPGQNDRADT